MVASGNPLNIRTASDLAKGNIRLVNRDTRSRPSRIGCDLVIPYDLLDITAVKILLNVLQTQAMRKELSSLPGYDASSTGKLICEVNSL